MRFAALMVPRSPEPGLAAARNGLMGERVFNPPDYLGTEGSEIHTDPRRLPLRQHLLRAELVAGSDRNSGPRLQLFVLHETWRRMDIAADRLSQDQHRRARAGLEIWNPTACLSDHPDRSH